jgi:hypothetical protein
MFDLSDDEQEREDRQGWYERQIFNRLPLELYEHAKRWSGVNPEEVRRRVFERFKVQADRLVYWKETEEWTPGGMNGAWAIQWDAVRRDLYEYVPDAVEAIQREKEQRTAQVRSLSSWLRAELTGKLTAPAIREPSGSMLTTMRRVERGDYPSAFDDPMGGQL